MPSEQTALDTRAESGVAAQANARLNIPLNLDNWKSLQPHVAERLLWFHQHSLDEGLSLKEAADAIGYDTSVVFRALKGTYEGSWPNIAKAIDSYKHIASERAGIQRAEFVETPNTRLIWSGLDYAVADNSMVLVSGESGLGKTIACEAWRDAHNHGRSVLAEVPPIGGTKALLRCLCSAIGADKNLAQDRAIEAIIRAFNPNRCLILDEARRLLPNDPRSEPVRLEIIRYIHDRTKCAVGLIATQRFDDTLKKLQYQYEQVLGRVMPVRLFRSLDERQFLPIVQQFIRRPSAKLKQAASDIANKEASGRIRTLVALFRLASRIASKSRTQLTEEHFFKALALRRQMMGEIHHAAK
jgi:DNA transposition AAA+ family ATPase